jgi:hypothetical protein
MLPNGISQGTGIMPRGWAVPHEPPLLARFLGKIVLDVLPAALASVIGGFLFTQYQFGHSVSSRPAVEEAAPASAEMLQLVRDEHTMIIDYLKAQAAAQKSRLAAEDQDTARAASDAGTAGADVAADASARHSGTIVVASKPAAARSKAPAAAVPIPVPAPHPPLLIAQADQTAAAAPTDRLTRDPDSLLAKTLDLKDHVVAATRQAVSAIGDVFSLVGQRIGGNPDAGSVGRQFSSAS